ncbi:26285_t:CDS:1, partial [Gigaspora rosea]
TNSTTCNEKQASLPVTATPTAKYHFLNANINNKITLSEVPIPIQTSMTKFTPSNGNISGDTSNEIQELHQQ